MLTGQFILLRRQAANSLAMNHGIQEMPVARAHVSRTKESSGFTTKTSRAVDAVQSALGVGGCGQEIFVLATCSL
jgi:hypothetical protein